MNASKALLFTWIFLFSAMAGARAADNVLITEFMAANDGTLLDENGDAEDWIELHNAGTNVVNLDGWFLTDKSTQLTQWRFPATNFPPGTYMIVWASSKNRRGPGAPLHTNFRLNNEGEYLALVRPDGITIASSYPPPFSPQVNSVSYGFPMVPMATTLIPTGAIARVLVPTDASLDSLWMTPSFDHSTWAALPTGIGYEKDGVTPFVPVTLANSVTEFSGTQGQNNWFYGYWNQETDADSVYSPGDFVSFPNGGGGWSANNFWTGANWDWFAGDPPFTQLAAEGGRPSGDNGAVGVTNQWAIRRYVSETNGPLAINGRITHTSDWVYVTQSGIAGTALLYLYLQNAGEGYIDDVKVVAGLEPESGINLLSNGDFESPTVNPWTVTANMSASTVSTTVKHAGNRSLHLVAAGAGSTQTDSIWQSFTVVSGGAYTLSYWYLPVTNNPAGVVRSSGSWFNTAATGSGDGVVARIIVDGTEVLRQPAFVSSVEYSVAVPVNIGSKIDFTLDAGSVNNSTADSATFTAALATADPTFMTVADTEKDWSFGGVQGEKNWYYGYYNKSGDGDATYQAANFVAFPRSNGPQGTNNFWDEQEWDWPSGDPPFDKIGQYWMIPNGTNSGAQHWVIKRWLSEANGTITVNWSALKELPDQNNPGGGGATVRIFHNGIQRDVAVIPGGDTVGVQRSVTISNVVAGDPIDIALDPTNVDGRPHGDTDKTLIKVTIRGSPSLTTFVGSDIGAQMQGVNSSAYLRIPFSVATPSAFNVLTLRTKYDEGLIAYLNGVEVARANAPMTPAWNSTAVAERPDSENNLWQEWNLTESLGLLRAGSNVLAIHGLNITAQDSDFLILPELVAGTVTNDVTARRYFLVPTPGAANGVGSSNIGPQVVEANHSPAIPQDGQNLAVIAHVSPTLNPVGSVQLIYRVMFSNEVTVPMFDDGAHGDGAAADGTWGATIPATASNPGQMVRYYVYATDSQGNGTRLPSFLEPKNSPQYFGTVVVDPSLTNQLPVMHFFVQDQVAATNFAGTRGSIFWDGEFFDNIGVNGHGQTTWFQFPKRSMNFDLNSGYQLRPHPDAKRVKSFDLITTSADKAYVRMTLGFETFRNAGVPTHDAFLIRMQQNGAFHSVMNFVEQANDDFLERNGLSPTGALYKIYLELDDAYTGAKKVTRQNEANDDLQAMLDGLDPSRPPAEVRNFLFDNVDIPEVVNFLATIQLVQNEDCCGKNYFLYRDTGGNREWKMFPWDLDLTFGRVFTAWIQQGTNLYGGYYNTNIYIQNLYYTQARSSFDFIGVGTRLPNAIFSFPDTYAMFFRRWTTVQEELLQKSSTHPLALKFEKRLDELAAQTEADAVLDFNKWKPMNPPSFLLNQTMPQAITLMKTGYFAPRRPWIFNTLAFANGGPNVGTQPTNATILFGNLEINPSSGDQRQEYVQLRNTNNYSVDVSGWKVSGGIDHTFKPGTVIASNGVMYLSPDVNAFRARTSGPRGGQGLFVQGNYKGQLSARGEPLQLADQNGRLVAATNFVGTPSLAQQYLRITEIMYNPAPLSPVWGLSTNADDYEFLELRNIGPSPISLIGVRLTNGVNFNFTGSAITNLAAGARLVVVRNQSAFAAFYGAGTPPIAGQYSGALDNNGENIRLEDATGERILDFAYNNNWYPITDGVGFSLVIVNDAANPETWDLKASWRPSQREMGTPGGADQPSDVVAPILITELTSHTVPPAIDTVELHNPTGTNVNVSGWFLTDDFENPRKYKIPSPTIIPAGGYLLLNESQFNPTNPPSPTGFAFSSAGDEVVLFSATSIGDLTGYYHGFAFGAAEAGVSFGRYVTSVGEEHFVAQSANTLPGANAAPRVGPIVISEIHYHPADTVAGVDNSADEFIELRNLANTNVALFHASFPTNTWQLRGGVDFDFPSNITFTANSFVLLVNFNPTDAGRLAAFRADLNVSGTVPIFGPYSGKLDNSSGAVRLLKPDAPANGNVPYILVDEVEYTDHAPWPPAADGAGPSLQRLIAGNYGNDPINWVAAVTSAGSASAAGTPPAITTQPTNQFILATTPTTFSVGASGTGPLHYQWLFNGNIIPGATASSYVIAYPLPENAGLYSVTVFNSAGAVQSSNALLNVALGPYFTRHPTNLAVRVGQTATYVAAAFGTPPVTFQWQFNGTTNVPGTVASTSSNTTLVISNVQVAHEGTYMVFATDSIGTVPATPATLVVLFDPFVMQPPLSQTVATNGTVTLSVSVTNNATLPIGYRWRRNGVFLPNGFFTLNEYTSYLVITNVQAPLTNYGVTVTNLARPAGITTASAFLTILADSDGDGIPDEWENQFGLLQGDASDRDGDLDGDTMSNYAEYVAGTNPTNSLSYLRIDTLTPGGGATLTFGAVSNRTYTIQYTEGVGTGQWSRLADVLARTINRVETIFDPSYSTNRFYRVATPKVP